MDSHLRYLAERQVDVVAAWQLRAAGWSRGKVQHHVTQDGWRPTHPGVYVLTSSPLRREQLWFAAVLTGPGSVLRRGSAGARYGFYEFERGYETITRRGQGGARRQGRVLVFRSKRLCDVTGRGGLPITTAARTLVDLAPDMTDKQLRRAFREAIRLRTTTAGRILDCVERNTGQRGTRALGALAARYAAIPYGRTRSDAEGLALEELHDAGAGTPSLNVKVAGEEADLVFAERRLIVEIDGPQYHRFRDEDERKEVAWRQAGFTVRRVPSRLVYDSPADFVETSLRPAPPRP